MKTWNYVDLEKKGVLNKVEILSPFTCVLVQARPSLSSFRFHTSTPDRI